MKPCKLGAIERLSCQYPPAKDVIESVSKDLFYFPSFLGTESHSHRAGRILVGTHSEQTTLLRWPKTNHTADKL